MPGQDISNLLSEWPYEPGRIHARIIEAEDDRPLLQVRVELGVLQMEMTGRPDGARPDGFESLCAYQQERLDRYRSSTGMEAGFVLSSDECRALREEAVQYYHRYVALFSLAEYEAVVRDTRQAMKIFDLCRDYGEREQDQLILEQFRPALIAMRTRAEAELAVQVRDTRQALAAIDRGLTDLRDHFTDSGEVASFEQSNEVQLLRGMRDALVPKLPSSQRVELQERLRAALDAENYELAAILRDELRMMGGESRG